MNAPNLVITGFMGTGKSTVGREVARRMGRPFVDMDELIETREGRTISEIFAQHGEPYFRRLEAELVRELAAPRGLVIATGGGTLVSPENRAVMACTSVIVCLWADEETLIARLQGQENRPLLAGPRWREALVQLLTQRLPAYRSLPYHVDTTGKTIEEVAEEVIRIYNEAAKSGPPYRGAGRE